MQTPPPNYSNYPRYPQYGQSAIPPRPPGIRFEAISEAWELAKQDFGTWAVAWLLVLALSNGFYYGATIMLELIFLGSMNASLDFTEPALFWVLYIAIWLFSTGMQIALSAGLGFMGVRRLRGETVTVANVFDGFRYFVPLFLVSILVQLMVIGGVLLCIIPGFWVAAATIFAPLLVMDKNMGVMEAIKTSVEALKNHAFPMLGLLIVTGLVVMLGLLACCIGILFTLPIYTFVLALHYHAFFPPQGQYAYGGFGGVPSYPYEPPSGPQPPTAEPPMDWSAYERPQNPPPANTEPPNTPPPPEPPPPDAYPR